VKYAGAVDEEVEPSARNGAGERGYVAEQLERLVAAGPIDGHAVLDEALVAGQGRERGGLADRGGAG
jgi:hypothetical protein